MLHSTNSIFINQFQLIWKYGFISLALLFKVTDHLTPKRIWTRISTISTIIRLFLRQNFLTGRENLTLSCIVKYFLKNRHTRHYHLVRWFVVVRLWMVTEYNITIERHNLHSPCQQQRTRGGKSLYTGSGVFIKITIYFYKLDNLVEIMNNISFHLDIFCQKYLCFH